MILMFIKKLILSKCPCCKERGIISFGKTGKYFRPVLICRCCGKKFRINSFLNILRLLIHVFVGAVALALKNHNVNIPLWAILVCAVLSHSIFEYFCPLEEQKARDDKLRQGDGSVVSSDEQR